MIGTPWAIQPNGQEVFGVAVLGLFREIERPGFFS